MSTKSKLRSVQKHIVILTSAIVTGWKLWTLLVFIQVDKLLCMQRFSPLLKIINPIRKSFDPF